MITILIPVNRLDRAKGRLASLLSADERRQLARATLETVLTGCPHGADWRIVVVTADPEVEVIARGRAAVVVEDPDLRGLNPQLERAIRLLPPEKLLIIHADLPLFTRSAVESMISVSLEPPFAVINPSGDGGTNAMFLSGPPSFPLAYGPDSAEKHRVAAETAGLPVQFVHLPALELDLDTPADLLKLLETPGGPSTRAGQLLQQMRIEERLAAR